MDYTLMFGALLWIESVVVVLLIIAFVTALAGQSKQRLIRIYVPILFVLILTAPALVLGSVQFSLLEFEQAMKEGGILIAWATVVALGAVFVVASGLRSPLGTNGVQAAHWSPTRLALLAIAISLFMVAEIASSEPTLNDLGLKIESGLFLAMIVVWLIGLGLRWKRGENQNYLPAVIVFVLSGNLIVLQLALVRAMSHSRMSSQPIVSSYYEYFTFGWDLLWIESLSAMLLLSACVTAFVSHWSRWQGQRYVPMLFTFLTAASASIVSQWLIRLHDVGQVNHPWIPYAVSWTLVYSLLAGLLSIKGLRQTEVDQVEVAANWPRMLLAISTGAAFILMGVTLTSMDAVITAQTASIQTDANARLAQMMLPAVAERDNAAPIYQQAIEALPNPQPYELLAEILGEEKPIGWRLGYTKTVEARDPKVEEFLKEKAAALGFLREASRKTDCRFDHDYSRGLGTLFPELSTIREGAMLLVLDAIAHAASGDRQDAEADLAAILRMHRHLTEPSLIFLAVSISIERLGATLMEKLIAADSKTREALRGPEFADLFGSSENDSRNLWNLRRACKGEEALYVASFNSLPTVLPTLFKDSQIDPTRATRSAIQARLGMASPWLLGTLYYRLAFLSDDLASYRQQMQGLQYLLSVPYPQAAEYLSKHWNQDPLEKPDHQSAQTAPGLVASLALPREMALYLRLATEADALHRLMRVAYSIIRYRAKYSKDPTKLDDLVPEFLTHIPLDPFDGKPLRMKKGATGVILYSVGPNLVDDGGVDGKEDQGDIVFRVP
jgi:hypothetical protein